jgi:putative methanogenesis marker protein 5
MAKVFIYPATSLILSDLVARYGHTPLSSAVAIRERIQTSGLESPPLQITPEEPKKGLKSKCPPESGAGCRSTGR